MTVRPIFSNEDSDLDEISWYVAGNSPYPKHTINKQKKLDAHRVVMSRILGRETNWPAELCDHINGNVLDCRRENLRVTDPKGNSQNRNKIKQIFRGVRFHDNRWEAQVNNKYIGRFNTPEEAAAAARRRRIELGYLGEQVTPSN